MFLKVRLRFIDIYKQNCSHTASTQRDRLQGPFNNTVRTPTAEDCLGKYLTPGTWVRELFATKWVHIKHYELKIGGPNSWGDSTSFLNSGNPEVT